ncbi:zinc ribbon domain-containing protein [Cohnella fermenti]|uniref:DUF2628 domain-containing protein n=1 Tax=Cohnella fermenti TaxID=2565925 RepID=A0A4S4BHH1_9BACL|nr:zinc ribbon domain-containing protein [Cohnella fermenti]THF73866.1 DUF2628 domain-containing protein [Cohnella fermenti]
MFCSNCGSSLSVQSNFCNACGVKVSSPASSNTEATGPTGPIAAGQSSLIDRLIGKNAAYYRSRWARPGHNKGWNWAAFFWWPYWMGYRKMYKLLFIMIVAVHLLIVTPLMMLEHTYLYPIIVLGLSVHFGMYSNNHYLDHINKQQKKHLSNPALHPAEVIGGTSWGGLVGTVVLLIILWMAILLFAPGLLVK